MKYKFESNNNFHSKNRIKISSNKLMSNRCSKKISNERMLSIVSNVSNMMIFEIRSIFYFFPKKNHEPEKISIDLID